MRFRIDPYPKYDADVVKDDVFSFLQKLVRRLDVFLVRIKIRRPDCRRFRQVLQGRLKNFFLACLFDVRQTGGRGSRTCMRPPLVAYCGKA